LQSQTKGHQLMEIYFERNQLKFSGSVHELATYLIALTTDKKENITLMEFLHRNLN
jgi:hypothetical protein